MAKKDQQQHSKKQKKGPKPSITNRDGFARASFLYQAANSITTTNQALSRMYVRSMDLVTKKNVLKVDPLMKRSFCKKCDRLQIPNLTASISIEDEGKQSETYQVKCVCGGKKRFPVGQDRSYELFSEKSKVDIEQ